MNIVNKIKNLFNKNKTDFICPDCNQNLYLTGQLKELNTGRGIYYLTCKKCNQLYIVENI